MRKRGLRNWRAPILGIILFFIPSVTFAYIWDIQTVDSEGDVGAYTSIALDSSNYPHISYYDGTNGDLKYAKWNGTSWNVQTVDSVGNVGLYTSIALDSNNYPHISYYDDYPNYDLKYARWDGTSWDIETVDSEGWVGLYTSIALDSNNYPHISYLDSYPNSDLKYAKSNGTSWDIETVDSEGYVGTDTSIALDSNNYPHISYYDDYLNSDLKYARWDGTSWDIETVDSEGCVGNYTSIALDSADYPHISYQDCTNYDLKYARWNGTSWNIQIVGSGSRHTSIALDSSNYPHISYHDWTNHDLKYARWNGSSWSLETVDSAGDVGHSTSIALDSANYPHISYYDYTNYDLKYATTLVPDTTSPTITNLTPPDGSTVTTPTPTISAIVADESESSGVNASTIQMTLDGNIVSHSYDLSTGLVSYTPEPLADGLHSVTLNVSDNAGNLAPTASWSFIVEVPPAGALKALKIKVQKMEDLKEEISISGIVIAQGLTAKLDVGINRTNRAIKDVTEGRYSHAANMINEAQNQLSAFVNMLSAQSGKKIPEELAQKWLEEIKGIIAQLEEIKEQLRGSKKKAASSQADLNADGEINEADLEVLKKAFKSKPGDKNWNPECDLNGDGKIDLGDFGVLVKEYNK